MASLRNIRALPCYSEQGPAYTNRTNRHEILNTITNFTLLEELAVAQLVKKFASFHETERFMTVFARQ
jgi:hypothetical protein